MIPNLRSHGTRYIYSFALTPAHPPISGERKLAVRQRGLYLIDLSQEKSHKMETNLIIVEAKKYRHADTCQGQTVAYMAMARRARMASHKSNAIIYGLLAHTAVSKGKSRLEALL